MTDRRDHELRAPRLDQKTQDTAQEILHQLIETHDDTYRIEVTPTVPGEIRIWLEERSDEDNGGYAGP